MKTPMNIRAITHEEFCNLKVGDTVFVKCGGHTFQSKITQAPCYNSDADEPDWEVETTNGFCDECSLYVREDGNSKKLKRVMEWTRS